MSLLAIGGGLRKRGLHSFVSPLDIKMTLHLGDSAVEKETSKAFEQS